MVSDIFLATRSRKSVTCIDGGVLYLLLLWSLLLQLLLLLHKGW